MTILFCYGQLFNATVLLNERVPLTSDCAQHTLFTWVPVAAYFLFLPILIRSLMTSSALKLRWTPLLATKIITQLLLIISIGTNWIANVIILNTEWQANINISYASVVAPVLINVVMVCMIGCIIACKLRGVITSGVLFSSLVLFAFFGVPELISRIHWLIHSTKDDFLFAPSVSFCIYFGLLLIQIFLHSFADKADDHERMEDTQQKASPENCSSFLNRILFWWFTSVCITGWRRPLTMSDIYDLNSEDKSEKLVQNWEHYWLPRVRKFMHAKKLVMHKQKAQADGEQFPSSLSANFSSNDENMKFVDGTRSTTTDDSKGIKFPARTRRTDQQHATSSLRFPRKPSVIWCLFLTFKSLIIPATILKTVADTVQFVNPMLLKALITFVQTKDSPLWLGYFYTAAMLLTSMIYTLFLHQYFDLILVFGMNLRTALSATVFSKVLKLSNSAQKERGVGETVNVMSTDIQRFQDTAFYINMIISNPYQIAFAIYFLWQQVGAAVLAGVAVMILLIPINYLISNQQRKYQVRQMRLKDERIKLMSEILNGIKVLKLYAWEESFEIQILKLRQQELILMRKSSHYMAVMTFLWSCAPVFVSVATFAVFALTSEEPLTAQKAFVSLALFNILRFPLAMLPSMTSVFVQANVSNKRLKSFLCADEIDSDIVDRKPDTTKAVVIENGCFGWDADSSNENRSSTLTDINLSIPAGQLIAIVGKVGSGKSSLLSAVLGEMEKIRGMVSVRGSIAYVPQQAWIQNMTLKDNILFENPLNARSYANTIEACSLDADIKILPAGDSTEIGEKGINLSGGQKQRVSLARAVYCDADVYLLDDPLSAVDAHVGKHIFENVISDKGVLKNKTRLLVTHGLQYLKSVDRIVVLTDGRITEHGTYQELLMKQGAFASILVNYLRESFDEQNDQQEGTKNENGNSAEEAIIKDIQAVRPELLNQLSSTSSESVKSASQKSVDVGHSDRKRSKTDSVKQNGVASTDKRTAKQQKLIGDEVAETGRVKRDVYKTYFAAMGYASLFGSILLSGIGNAFSASANFWLSTWSEAASKSLENFTDFEASNDPDVASFSNEYYLSIYVLFGVLQGVFVLFAAVVLSFSTIAASKILHLNLVHHLFRAPLSFFDATPFGRILNRCGKDVDVIDSALATTIRSWISCACSVIATVAVICVAVPYFGIVIVPLSVLYYFVLRFYVSTSRQLKRLESVTRSPIFSLFQESIAGVTSIRAYGVQERFKNRCNRLMDINQSCYYATLISNRWLAVRLEFIGNLMAFFASLFAVLGRDQFNGGEVGLAISYALAVTQVLNWAVRMTSDLEANIVSVERVKEYSEIKIEADWVSVKRPPDNWPAKGSFVFDDFCLKYRPDLEPVLKRLNLRIEGGEKVGIVGRTGAGKSSLTLALFRIVEPCGGRILLDGLDVSTLGLHDLRSRLTIIPQDPILFSSKFRFNLDPFDKYTDDEIWTALEQAHLKNFIASQPEQLSFNIVEGGENLSVGQRQLVCLARALLRKTKVLVLDEATAAVDLETDDLVQKSIRQYFADCTILTIAHRLNTIMDSDKILVLSDGRIIEFDSPSTLLQNKISLFYALAQDAGLV